MVTDSTLRRRANNLGYFLHKVRGKALYTLTVGGSDPNDIRLLEVPLAEVEDYLSDFPPHNMARLKDELQEAKAEVRTEKRMARWFNYTYEDEGEGKRLEEAQRAYDQAEAQAWLLTHNEDDEDSIEWQMMKWKAFGLS